MLQACRKAKAPGIISQVASAGAAFGETGIMAMAMPQSLWAATSKSLQDFPVLAGSLRANIAIVGGRVAELSLEGSIFFAGS